MIYSRLSQCTHNHQLAPIENPEFQLVSLHPHQLLPNRLPLLRHHGDHGWMSYIATSDGLLRQTTEPEDTSAPLFPPLRYSTSRRQIDQLNAWFVVMNAGIKFERFANNYGLERLDPSIQPIAEQTLRIVDLIYTKIIPTQDYLASLNPTRKSSRARMAANYKEESSSDLNPEGMEGNGEKSGDAGQSYSGGSQTGKISVWNSEKHSNEVDHIQLHTILTIFRTRSGKGSETTSSLQGLVRLLYPSK